jgi:hypothetical protein
MSHGLSVAPPPISEISGWFHDAKRVARAVEAIGAARQPSGAGDASVAFPPFPSVTPDMDPTAVADARAMYQAGGAFFERHSGSGDAADAEGSDPAKG